MFVRATHPFAFRSGEWAQIIGTVTSPVTGRIVWLVVFGDGATDEWVVRDTDHGYELRTAAPV